MGKLILEPTAVAQWQRLVKDAEAEIHLQLAEILESYLTYLLMRFNNKPEMLGSVLAFEFMHSIAAQGVQQKEQLRDVGDKCLLLAGLFPKRAEYKLVKVSYFVDLGQGAYTLLASLSRQTIAELYTAVGQGFVKMMDILQTIRQMDKSNVLTPLQAIELFNDTGSQQALAALRHYTHASPISISSKKYTAH